MPVSKSMVGSRSRRRSALSILAQRLVSLLRVIQEYLKYTHSSIDRKWVPCRFENQESSTAPFVSPAVEDEKRKEAGQERRGHEMN